jgi:hypothetical protein
VQRGRAKFTRQLAREVLPLFMRYQSNHASFGDTRSALLDCVRAYGTLAYVAPRT